MSSTHRELLIFAKEPVPGRVKTRLAQTVGEERAAAIYGASLDLIVRRCGAGTDWKTAVVLAPDDAAARSQSFLPPGLVVRPQGDGGLGDRLARALTLSWEGGAHQVVMIGTDNPDLREPDIAKAFAALDRTDTVVGPTLDGGYYLIGFRQPARGDRPPLAVFQGIDWSTERVYQQTLDRLRETGLSRTELRIRRDIDHWADFLVLQESGDAESARAFGPFFPAPPA